MKGYLNGNKYTMQRPIQKLIPFEINNSTKRKLKNENSPTSYNERNKQPQ